MYARIWFRHLVCEFNGFFVHYLYQLLCHICRLILCHYCFKALNTVATLPFHLVNDLWRWKIFRNETNKQSWNALFWKLKEEYLGVKAPVKRTEQDLDPPTLFHVSNNYDMIR